MSPAQVTDLPSQTSLDGRRVALPGERVGGRAAEIARY
jgi:hypothetical protein